MKFILVLVLLCLAGAACRKDTGRTGPRLVKSMTIDGNGCVINCLYDDQRRAISITQCDTVETYTYFTDSISYVRKIAGGLAYRYTYLINASGIATGYTKVASDGSVTLYSFTYDAHNNRIMTTDNTNPNTLVTYTIVNNNGVLDSSVSSLLGSGNYTISRTYYANTDI